MYACGLIKRRMIRQFSSANSGLVRLMRGSYSTSELCRRCRHSSPRANGSEANLIERSNGQSARGSNRLIPLRSIRPGTVQPKRPSFESILTSLRPTSRQLPCRKSTASLGGRQRSDAAASPRALPGRASSFRRDLSAPRRGRARRILSRTCVSNTHCRPSSFQARNELGQVADCRFEQQPCSVVLLSRNGKFWHRPRQNPGEVNFRHAAVRGAVANA